MSSQIVPFGKYQGKKFVEVPISYLRWFRDQDWAEKWKDLYDYTEDVLRAETERKLKAFQNAGIWMMSPAHQKLLWSLWRNACDAQMWRSPACTLEEVEQHRKRVTLEVFGSPRSWKSINQKEEFDKLKSRLELLAGKVQGGIEDGHREYGDQRRLLWKFHEVQYKCVALYMPSPDKYLDRLLKERFKVVRDWTCIEDLDARPTIRTRKDGTAYEASDLLLFIETLDARINVMRNAAGDTIHEMKIKAGAPCVCVECKKSNTGDPF